VASAPPLDSSNELELQIGETEQTTGTDVDVSGDGEELEPPFITLCRVGRPNTRHTIKTEWTVEQLKQELFPTEFAANQRIRFIFQGKILEDADTLAQAGIDHDAFVHCVITEARSEEEIAAADQELAEESQFPRQLVGFHQDSVGTHTEFVLGFFLGAFLGIFMLIWLWQPRMSRRHKLGILCGIFTNMFLNYTHPDQSGNGNGRRTSPPQTGTSSDLPDET